MVAARTLRVLSALLLGGLALLVAGSVLAFGSVYHWAHEPLFYATGVLAAHRSRPHGHRSCTCAGGWDVPASPSTLRAAGWSSTWRSPTGSAPGRSTWTGRSFPVPPLLLPGVLFAIWVVIQMMPLPAGGRRRALRRGSPAGGGAGVGLAHRHRLR